MRGALRLGVGERQPTPRDAVAVLDGGGLRRSPLAAFALVVPPMFAWSIDEARAGAVAAAAARRPRQRMRAVEDLAYALMTFDHVRRTRRLAARLARELPFNGLPTASSILGDACEQTAATLTGGRAAAAGLLVAYVEQQAAATGAASFASAN